MTTLAATPTTSIVLPEVTIVSPTTMVTTAAALPQSTIQVSNTSGFAPAGTIEIANGDPISYTGLTSNSFTGCTGGSGNINVGDIVLQVQTVVDAPPSTIVNVDTTGFPVSGTLLGGPQPINYTGITPTSFTGCTTPPTTFANLTNNTLFLSVQLPQTVINVASTVGFSTAGSFTIPFSSSVVNYTGITPTSFTGCTTSSLATLGPDQAVIEVLTLPLSVIDVTSTNGFTPTGALFIPAIGATINYTGITPTEFTGCTTTSTATLTPGLAINQVVTSGLLNLAPFGNPVRVGLSGNQTVIDTFQLYGTDDASVVSTAGGTLLANLQGGGGVNSNALVAAYQYVYVVRTGGFTVGNLLAWGASDI